MNVFFVGFCRSLWPEVLPVLSLVSEQEDEFGGEVTVFIFESQPSAYLPHQFGLTHHTPCFVLVRTKYRGGIERGESVTLHIRILTKQSISQRSPSLSLLIFRLLSPNETILWEIIFTRFHFQITHDLPKYVPDNRCFVSM